MFDKQLREIRQMLDSIPGDDNETDDNQYCFDLVEERAIIILDSSDSPDLMQEYMMSYLYLRQLEYQLIDFPDPQES
jgi:hypothetical protein